MKRSGSPLDGKQQSTEGVEHVSKPLLSKMIPEHLLTLYLALQELLRLRVRYRI
jgi:hypothetical protein